MHRSLPGFAAGSILTAAAAFLVLGTLHCGVTGRGTPVRPLDLLPRDVDFAAGFDIRDIIHGPLGDVWLHGTSAGGPGDEGDRLERFERETGIDLRRDLDRLVVGGELEPGGPGPFVAVVTGRFDPERVRNWLRRGDPPTTDYRGIPLTSIRFPGGTAAGREIHVGFLPGPVAVFGDPERVADSIDLFQGFGVGLGGDPDWVARLEEVDTGLTAWSLVVHETLFRSWGEFLEGIRPGFGIGDLFTGIRAVAAEVRIPDRVEITIRGELTDPARAPEKAATLRASVAILRTLMGETHPRADELLSTLRIEDVRGGIEIEGAVPFEWLDQIPLWADGPVVADASAGTGGRPSGGRVRVEEPGGGGVRTCPPAALRLRSGR